MSEKLTELDAVKIKARAVIPIVRALEREIGDERAHAIVGRAIAESHAEWQAKAVSTRNSHPRDNNIEEQFPIETEVVEDTDSTCAINMTRCAMFERMSASPGMLRATLESAFRIDVRPILPTITAPTLVIHARDDLMPVQGSRYLADHIPGAQYLEVDGANHAPWLTEPDRILTEIEEFLTGSHAPPSQSHRALRTVLFTDIVASTQHAAAAGDERWRAVLHRFGEITADLTQQFGGTVVKSTGDGHLATFDGPTQAIRCAEALRADAKTLGIQIRAGIHTGECELLDTDIGGLAVHIAARILGHAGAGEILVSRTVRDLVVGSGTGFEDRGSVELRGVPGTWQLLAVNRHGPPAGSTEAELASTPTPGPRTAMRRSDRAVAVMARRTPWILRGMGRLTPTVRS
jgi:class 3 adenylate cyclase